MWVLINEHPKNGNLSIRKPFNVQKWLNFFHLNGFSAAIKISTTFQLPWWEPSIGKSSAACGYDQKILYWGEFFWLLNFITPKFFCIKGGKWRLSSYFWTEKNFYLAAGTSAKYPQLKEPENCFDDECDGVREQTFKVTPLPKVKMKTFKKIMAVIYWNCVCASIYSNFIYSATAILMFENDWSGKFAYHVLFPHMMLRKIK